MKQRRGWMHRAALSCLAAATVVVPLIGVGITGEASQTRAAVGGQPDWAVGRQAQQDAPRDQVIDLSVILRLRDQVGLEQFAQAVSTPGNPAFHHYISAATFHRLYSPSAQAVNSVTSFLRASHLQVVSVPDNRLWVRARGTVAQAEHAFNVRLGHYSTKSGKRRAPDSAPTVPAFLGQVVEAVDGLSDSGRSAPTNIVDGARVGSTNTPTTSRSGGNEPPPPAFVNAPPCSTYWAQKIATTAPTAYGVHQPYAPCGYTPAQFRGAYGTASLVSHGVDGAGFTVGIVDAYAAPTILADSNQYSAKRGEPGMATGQFTQLQPAAFTNQDLCGPQGWYGEETLDVEAVHGMAPGTNIVYLAGASCFDQDLIDALNTAIDGHLVDILSNSWGNVGDIDQLDAATAHAYTHTFLQAVTEGIGVQFSSGDNGDEISNAGFRTVDFPASDPWVTAVGGTSLGIGKKNNYLFETGWGTSKTNKVGNAWSPAPPGIYLYGAGGGTSQVFKQPFYQKGVVPNSISGYFGGNGRAVPDIAMDADPQTGMLIGETQTFPDASVKYSEYRIGGTSLACPLLAGMMALADQGSGFAIGFANPGIYKYGRTSAIRDIVNPAHTMAVVRNNFNNSVDATGGITTSLRTFNTTGTLHTRPGYDDVTGVGTPNGLDFISSVGF